MEIEEALKVVARFFAKEVAAELQKMIPKPEKKEDPPVVVTRVYDGEIIDAEELASALAVKRSSVYRWAAEGKIPKIKVGMLLRFNLEEVMETFSGK